MKHNSNRRSTDAAQGNQRRGKQSQTTQRKQSRSKSMSNSRNGTGSK